jgi:hypothetical protein
VEELFSRFNEAATKESIQKHTATPHISSLDYWNQLTKELGEFVSGRKKIYLDTCYWVYLRDAAMGRPKKPEHSDILQLLRKLVSQGSVICPVSDIAFTELMQQTDDVSRRETTILLDELSLSVALQFEEYRMRCELETFLLERPINTIEKVSNKIWTKASYILGPKIPSFENLPISTQIIIRKVSLDLFWEAKFEDMANVSMAELGMSNSFDRAAAEINNHKNNYQHEIPSLQRALTSEIAGIVDVFLDHAESILSAHFHRINGKAASARTDEERQKHREELRNVLVNIFVYKREKAKYMLPSFYAHSLQHAAFRMDSKRKFQGSFLRDMHHGTAGVVWHDVMLTERALQTLLTKKDVALDKTFECVVLNRPDEILNYLRKLD